MTVFFSVGLSVQQVQASQFTRPETISYNEYVKKKITSLINVSSFPEHKAIWIEFRRDKNGKIISPKISQSCGDKKADLACLEATFESSPLKISSDGGSWPDQQMIVVIEAKDVLLRGGAEQSASTGSSMVQAGYLIHLVPRTELFKALFDSSELEAAANLVSLGSDSSKAFSRLYRIHNSWSEFLRKNPEPTKTEVLQHAQWIRKNFRLTPM